MTDVRFPDGTIVRFDDKKYSPDQIKQLAQGIAPRYGGAVQGGSRFVNGKLMPEGQGAPPESASPSGPPTPQPTPKTVPTVTPAGGSIVASRSATGIPQGGDRPSGRELKADLPQEGISAPRTISELQAGLKARKDEGAQAGLSTLDKIGRFFWNPEGTIEKAITEGPLKVTYEVGRAIGGKELGRDLAGMWESEMGRVPELIHPRELPAAPKEIDSVAKDAAETFRANVAKRFDAARTAAKEKPAETPAAGEAPSGGLPPPPEGATLKPAPNAPFSAIKLPNGKVITGKTPRETHYDVLQRALEDGTITRAEAEKLEEDSFGYNIGNDKFIVKPGVKEAAIKSETLGVVGGGNKPPMGPIPGAGYPYPSKGSVPPRPLGRASQAFANAYSGAHAAVNGVLNGIKNVVAPATINKSTPYYGSYNLMAEAIRSFIGYAHRDSATAEAAVEPFLSKFNKATDLQKRVWMAYVEGRTTKYAGKTLRDADMQKAANIVKATMDHFKRELLSLPKYAKIHFIEDYLTHIWEDPKAARAAFGVGKFGTGRWTKLRDIPTIEDGLRKGLRLKYDNPLNAVMEYVYGMSRHIAKERTLQYARDQKWLKFSNDIIPGHEPIINVFDAIGRQGQLPEDMARIFNNFLSRGAAGIGPEFGAIYNAVQKATNFSTRAVLSFSGYHALNVGASAIADANGRAISQIVGGKLTTGLKTLATLKGFAAPIYYPFKGRKLAQQYANLSDFGPRMRRIADQASRANARVKDLNNMIDFKSTAQGSFIKAWKQGRLGKELKGDLQRIKDTYGAGTLGVIGKNLGRVADTTSAWLFEHYIPALKNGALYYNLSDWIDRHPTATQAELDDATRAFVDSIDNRFGMMQRDNLFWNKLTSQIGQAALLSDTWQLGFIREFGGAIGDLNKFAASRGDTSFLSTRVSYIMGYALSTGLIGGVTTYMLTGSPPTGLKDLFYPRTGGKNPDGSEERILLPGHLKEVAEWERIREDIPHHAGRELIKVIEGKVNPFWPLASQVINAKDYRDKDIAPTGATGDLIRAEISLVLQHLTPIVAQSLETAHGDKSKLNPVTDVLGIRSAPSYTSYEKSNFLEKSRALNELKRKMLGEMIQLRQNPSDTNLAAQIKKDKQDLEVLSQQKGEAQSAYKGTLSP